MKMKENLDGQAQKWVIASDSVPCVVLHLCTCTCTCTCTTLRVRVVVFSCVDIQPTSPCTSTDLLLDNRFDPSNFFPRCFLHSATSPSSRPIDISRPFFHTAGNPSWPLGNRIQYCPMMDVFNRLFAMSSLSSKLGEHVFGPATAPGENNKMYPILSPSSQFASSVFVSS